MASLFLLLVGGGIAYYFFTHKGDAAAVKQLPPGPLPQKCTTFDAPMEEGIRNAYSTALIMESDPKELEAMAASMNAICQPTAAKALLKKAELLRADGIPDGFDPNKMKLPGDGSPEPPAGSDVIALPTLPGVGAPKVWKQTGASIVSPPTPTAGLQSWPTEQWWTTPTTFSGSTFPSLIAFAKYDTGDGLRYVEMIQWNSEKKTVGDPTNPILTGYSFVALADDEQIRVPITWNVFIDQLGNIKGDGSQYTPDPNMVLTGAIPTTLPDYFPTTMPSVPNPFGV